MFDPLLQKGYFPQELPPPFQTITLGQAMSPKITSLTHPFIHDPKSKNPCISRPTQFNLARAGTLRRLLSIPNPINYIQLSHIVDNNWNDLLQHIHQSNLSLSKPTSKSGTTRSIQRYKELGELAEMRAATRVNARYLLRADINAFYSSIYTHSIPWALHTKATAKTQRHYNQLLGNKLDTLIRNGQDQQTKGIPIGPDTSLIVAESILTVIDQELQQLAIRGFRYVDDYELCFWSHADAEAGLALLQELLTEFELQLNPTKTKIDELPIRVEPRWVAELRMFEFRSGSRSQHTDIIQYFDRAFDFWKEYPDEAVLKYAVARSKSEVIPRSNWQLYEGLLLQCSIAEAGTLPLVIDLLKRYHDKGYRLNEDRIRETFARIVEVHAPRGHGSEVAWVLWGTLVLGLNINDATADIIGRMNDSIIALLALDAQSKGLIDPQIQFNLWMQSMVDTELYGPNWLIAYQAYEYGWLLSSTRVDYIAQDPSFSLLRSHNVKFYDNQCSISYSPQPLPVPKPPMIYTGGY